MAYYGQKEWDAPKDMYGMLDIPEAGSIAFYLKLSDEFCAHGQAVTGSEGMLHVRCSSAGRIFSMQK